MRYFYQNDQHNQQNHRFSSDYDNQLQRSCACGRPVVAGGECAECRKKRLGLQRQAANQATPTAVPPIVHEVLRSPGRPLDPAVRTFIEPRFGHDFSHVRVHTDTKAAKSARAVNALAYTVGPDLVFGEGQYAPGTSQGQRLLAHELTHVIQQPAERPPGELFLDTKQHNPLELEAERAERTIEQPNSRIEPGTSSSRPGPPLIRRRVRPENVSCSGSGLRNPNLSGGQVVAALQAADAEAIELALRAERLLEFELLFTQMGEPVNAQFDTILQEELGLSLANPAHHRLIGQQINRFRRVRETLEGGNLRYMCRGGTVSLVGCQQTSCGAGDFAFACSGNRLIVLCQQFWDNPDQRAATLLHEPFHIWFSMARHAPNALRRADASCFESFALRVAGQNAFTSCRNHTAG